MADCTERWRPVSGYEGFYEVSDRGRVRSMSRTVRGGPSWSRSATGIVLRARVDATGRCYVSLWKENREWKAKVHRLTLDAFVGPCPPGMEGCHNDGNPMNNGIENLRWDTHISNIADRASHGTENIGSRNGQAKLDESAVCRLKRRLLDGAKQKDVAEEFGVSAQTVCDISKGRSWTHVNAGAA